MPKSTLVHSQNTNNDSSLSCMLLWRRNQLLVKPINIENEYLDKLSCKQLLVDCLNHSPVNLVRIDPQLGEEQVNLWADACQEVKKPIYLRIPSANIKHNISYIFRQWLQQAINWLLAFILLLALMPFLVLLVIWMKFYYHKSLFTYEWSVGKRGKLFRIIKLCAADIQQITSNEPLILSDKNMYVSKKQQNMTKIIKLMHKYGINKLPQLLNVLRGEMMLFGSNCWILKDAVSLSDEKQKQLNKIPGIISLSQINLQSRILNIDSQTL